MTAHATTSEVLTRRSFLTVSAGAVGGLMVSLYFDLPLAAQGPATAMKYPPSAFVHIKSDGKIAIVVNRLEFGQGVHTALPMVMADELDADWSQVTPELAPAGDVYRDPAFGIQMVGGSGSIAHSFEQYRKLGAQSRAMLISAAAARWGVPPSQCRTEKSVVYGPAGKSARYSELAESAAKLPVPDDVPLKKASEFRYIGKPTPRLDSMAKCNGTQRFGMDLDLPGMLVALVAHPPSFGGKAKSFDGSKARAIEGVKDVFEIPTLSGGTAVAVVAEKFWPAKQARDLLQIDWDLSAPREDSAKLFEQYRQLAGTPGNVAVARGDEKAFHAIPAERRIEAMFEFPYLAHAPMEPLNTTVRFDGDKAEVWAGSQFQTFDQMAVAEVLGLKPDQVLFHTEFAGGGFGRRAVPDSHVQREAAAIAKRIKGVPVKLIWAREDDVQGGYYRPMHVHRVEVGIGDDGMPAAWRHGVVGQSIMGGTPFAQMMVKNGVDGTLVEGAADNPYNIPNFHITGHHPKVNVPILWWRSVGHTHTGFVMETLVEELADRARMDPIEYRRELLKPDAKKLRGALDLMAEKSAGWRAKVPKGHAVGFALHECFGTAVACAVEVSVEKGRPRIHRVTYGVDCGTVVNPLTVESQFQAGAIFGLTQIVSGGAITLKDGRVEQSNFDGFTPPYMQDAPVAIDVYTVASGGPPTGCGEPPVPVIAPAVVNALARLTGKRYRVLPLKTL